MLDQFSRTIAAEIRDFPEWRRERETYAIWIVPLETKAVHSKFQAAREHLSGYLLEPYHRQPHVTLFVCGFLGEVPRYNDDFTGAQLQRQLTAVGQASLRPFEIEIGGLNSFASAPFLEVSDPQGGIIHLRESLSRGAREFRTAPYTPHLTVGLYAGAFPSEELAQRLIEFPPDPTRLEVKRIAFATYRAQEIGGLLIHRHEIAFN